MVVFDEQVNHVKQNTKSTPLVMLIIFIYSAVAAC